MMAGIIGGLFISVVLIIAKKLVGYEKLTCRWVPFAINNIKLRRPSLAWVAAR
jgi:hypothetical protein